MLAVARYCKVTKLLPSAVTLSELYWFKSLLTLTGCPLGYGCSQICDRRPRESWAPMKSIPDASGIHATELTNMGNGKLLTTFPSGVRTRIAETLSLPR